MLLIRDADVTGQEIVVVHHRQKEKVVERRMARKMVKMESKVMEEMKMMTKSPDKDVLDADLDVVEEVDIQEVVDLEVIDVVCLNVMELHQKETEQPANLKENVDIFAMEAEIIVEMDVHVLVEVVAVDLEVLADQVDSEADEDQAALQVAHVAVIIPTMSLN
jgi:hypothetical protein